MFMLTPLAGFAARDRRRRTFGGVASSGTDATSYTFSGMALSAAATDRIIVVGITYFAVGGGLTTSSVTVAGISATQIAQTDAGVGGSTQRAELWAARVPTGTTGDVVVTISGTAARCAAVTYALYGGGGGVGAFRTSTDNNSNPAVTSVVSDAGGVVITVAGANDNVTATTTGATEDADAQIGGEASRITSASIETSVYATNTVSTTFGAGPTAFISATASWI